MKKRKICYQSYRAHTPSKKNPVTNDVKNRENISESTATMTEVIKAKFKSSAYHITSLCQDLHHPAGVCGFFILQNRKQASNKI